jgi:DNA-binding SARP family transcriptional activator/Tfp pilus assembly protein PilF
MRFALFGPLVVAGDSGQQATLAGPRLRVLLATLLLHADTPVSAHALAEAVWDGEPPPAAIQTLRSYVRRLRRALGPQAGALIEARDPGYLIRLAGAELDVLEFETLCQEAAVALSAAAWSQASDAAAHALELWRGAPLLDVPSRLLHDEIVPLLDQLRVQALEDRAEADLHLGRHERLVPQLRDLTVQHPLRERFHAQLMLALYRCSRRAEALESYRDARRALVGELGIEPGPDLRRLHERVLAGDTDLLAPPQGDTAPESGRPAPVPRQLPAPVTYFTGRAWELKALDGLLDQAAAEMAGTVVISAIGGTAGVGKTALAVHWAHQIAARFPDGQLYVNLRGYDPAQPMTAADALAGFLRALGVPSQDIPAEAGERAALYRSLLAGRRILVVADNAGSAEQVRLLLPGTHSGMTIVTSRSSLAGLVARDGAQRLDLDLLPLAEAVGLLRALIGERVDADPGAAATLAAQCSRLPLALRVAAERAIARSATPLADLAGELADQQRRLDLLDAGRDPHTAVRAVFSWSYRVLDVEERRAFRLLGLHPGAELDRFALAALTGGTPGRADGMLELLARASLIQRAQPGRYGLHDLLRAYARELATAQDPDSELAAALTRLFDYYLHAAAAAMDVLVPAENHRRPRPVRLAGLALPAFQDAAAARAWLERERASLVAAAGQMSAGAWPGHAIQLAATLFRHFQVSGHYPEAIALHSCAFHAAHVTGDHAAEATALINLGAVRVRQGDIRQATEDLRQALVLARRSGDRTCAARALHTLGNIGFHEGRYEQAAGYYEQALIVYRQLGDPTGEARTLNNLGSIDELTGRYQEAAKHYGQGLALYRQTGEQAGEARALGNLGSVYRRQGRYQQAVGYLERSLTMSHAADDRCGEAYAVTYLGDVRQCEGRYQQAAGHYQQALTMFRAFGDRSGEVIALNGLGEALLAEGHRDAREPHATALDLASQTDNGYEQARAHYGLARVYQSAGQPGQARHHWQHALAEFTRLGTPEADQVRAELATADGHRDREL